MLKTIQNGRTREVDMNPTSSVSPLPMVHRDCRRGEVKRDLAAVLAAFDEGRSCADRVNDCLADRLLRAMRA